MRVLNETYDLILQFPRSLIKKPLRLILVAIVILEASFGATVILIPLMLTDISIGTGELPNNWWLMIVLYYVISLGTASWFGYLSDRIGRRPLLIFGTFIATLSFLPFTFYNGPDLLWVLFIANGIKGLGNAAIVGPNMALFADFAPKNESGESMGMFYLARSAGGAIGFLFASLAYGAFGTWSFLLFALMMLVATQIFLLISEPRSLIDLRALQMAEAWKIQIEGEDFDVLDINPFRSVTESLKDREFFLFALVWLLFSSIIGIAVTYAPTILSIKGINPAFAVIPILAVAIIVGLSQPRFGRLSDNHGRKPFLLLGAIGTTLLVAILRAILSEENFENYISNPLDYNSVIQLRLSDLLPIPIPFSILTIVLALLVLCAAAFPSASMGFLADVTKQGERGGKMGLIQSLLAVGNIIGITLGGAVLEYGGVLGVLSLCFIIGLATTMGIFFLLSESSSIRYLFGLIQKT